MLSPQRDWQGAGLLLLRLTAVIVPLRMIQCGLLRGRAFPVLLLAITFAVLSTLGLFTSIASCLMAALIALLFYLGWSLDGLTTLYGLLTCFSLALIGPGAYSLDNLLFGRRRITLPESTRLSRGA